MAHCARRGEEDLTWRRMAREIEDEKSKWGSTLKEDWKELGVNSVRGWCNKVKDRCWLASKLDGSRKKKKREEEARLEIIVGIHRQHVRSNTVASAIVFELGRRKEGRKERRKEEMLYGGARLMIRLRAGHKQRVCVHVSGEFVVWAHTYGLAVSFAGL